MTISINATIAHDPVHFSDLKKFALSPAHFKDSLVRRREYTRAMRVGTVTHHLVLGAHTRRPVIRYDGDRRAGKDWDKFLAEFGPNNEIVTAPEWDDAIPIAQAVLDNPVAARLLVGRREMPLAWDESGIACATHGIDVVGDGWLADLKTTTCTEPEAWKRHAFKHLYPQQMAFYERAAKAHGIRTDDGLFLIGVEVEPPYAVTCLELSPALVAHGHRSCALWLERLRIARENDFWPGYTQTMVEFDVPAWMGAGDDDDA
jgi:hypothetical protein